MRFVLLDNEKGHNEILRQMLINVCKPMYIDPVFALCASSWQAVLNFARANTLPCVYMLDIELEQEINGIQLCEQVRELDSGAIIVYVSAYQHYALQCCKSHAFDFLLKPFTQEELSNCIQAAEKELCQARPEHTLQISFGNQSLMLPLEEVLFFEKKRMLVVAHLWRDGRSTEHTWRSSFKELLPSVNGLGFVQCHRSYIVNALKILSANWTEPELTLVNGTKLPISRRDISTVRIAMGGVHS